MGEVGTLRKIKGDEKLGGDVKAVSFETRFLFLKDEGSLKVPSIGKWPNKL